MMTQKQDPTTLSGTSINSHHQQREVTISTTTEAIAQLSCQLMENLNRRSTALANGANFDRAFRDAALMQAISPTSSLGYMQAGYIYQQQGRHEEAAAIYEKGLTSVPSSDNGYTNIQLQHEDARNQASKRIDFISQLPLEIVVSALLPLVFHNYRIAADTRCPYLYVSRTWRQRVVQCNSLSFHNHERMSSSVFQFREVERFSAHTKKLSLQAGRTVSYEDPLLIFNRCQFPNLTNLSILCTYARIIYHRGISNSSPVDYGYEDYYVIFALQSVHHTLTHLDLYTQDNLAPVIHLGGILDVCPNLVSLKLTTMTIQPLTMQHPKLTHLTMCIGIEPLSNNTMTNILSHLPALVSFDTLFVPDTRFLASIFEYCPEIKLLKCGGFHTFHPDNYDAHVHGMQKFAIGFMDAEEPSDTDHIITFLLEHHNSLDHIILEGKITGQGVTLGGGSLDFSVEFNRLKDLDVDVGNNDLALLALSIIRQSPHLQHVTLSHHAASRVDICIALKGLSRLTMLWARDTAPDTTSFHNILEHHVKRGKDSSLEELKVVLDSNTAPSSWMHTIAGLQNLQKLVISTAQIETPSDYFSIIATITTGCPSLLHLDLDCGRYPSPEGFVSQINDHSKLHTLRLRASSIGVKDIVDLFSLTNLQHVIIIAPVEDYLIEFLRKHMVNVEHRRY